MLQAAILTLQLNYLVVQVDQLHLLLTTEMVNHVKNDKFKIEIKINCFENKRLKLRLN